MDKTSSASAVISLRLTSDERRLVDEAAAKMGWKTAHFLRVSAIERAAHILNLSRPTSFDFAAAARRFAQALAEPRTVKIRDADPELTQEFGPFGDGAVDFPQNELVTLNTVQLTAFSPAPLSATEIDQLQQAIRLGGAEFATQLLAECRRAVSTGKGDDLPPPIDPHNLKDFESESV